MAYVVAEMDDEEMKQLTDAGFELEDPPMEMIAKLEDETPEDFAERVRKTKLIFVDCDARDLLLAKKESA